MTTPGDSSASVTPCFPADSASPTSAASTGILLQQRSSESLASSRNSRRQSHVVFDCPVPAASSAKQLLPPPAADAVDGEVRQLVAKVLNDVGARCGVRRKSSLGRLLRMSSTFIKLQNQVHVMHMQRHWRGAYVRMQVIQAFLWRVSQALDYYEERRSLELTAMIENHTPKERPTPLAQVNRRLRNSIGDLYSLVDQHLGLGHIFGLIPNRTSHSRSAYLGSNDDERLPFPLTEAAVRSLLSGFDKRSVRLHYKDAQQLIEREIELLASLPNVVEYEIPAGQRLCVVGDLHGQLPDLMHIFRSHGTPDADRPFLFNGDFVDRGKSSVEITILLFAFHQLYPKSVYLNRGNHEERSVYTVHGFELECKRKYDSAMCDLFGKAFDHLPIATVVNKKVFVVHGGVDDELTVEKLKAVPRKDYVMISNSLPERGIVHPMMRTKMAALRKRAELFKPITTALWSDPMKKSGVVPNKDRGAGSLFGPDVADRFLKRHGFELIIRSHEQVIDGVAWPFRGKQAVTVFSASNYSGTAKNKGGYVLLSHQSLPRASATTAGFYIFSNFNLSVVTYEAEQIPTLQIEQQQLLAIQALVFEKRAVLRALFAEVDTANTKIVDFEQFTNVIAKGIQIPVGFKMTEKLLYGRKTNIDYDAFLRRFKLAIPILESIYPMREHLIHLMHSADEDAVGYLRLMHFRAVCRTMRRVYQEKAQICDKPTNLLKMMGPVGETALQENRLHIAEMADGFRVVDAMASQAEEMVPERSKKAHTWTKLSHRSSSQTSRSSSHAKKINQPKLVAHTSSTNDSRPPPPRNKWHSLAFLGRHFGRKRAKNGPTSG